MKIKKLEVTKWIASEGLQKTIKDESENRQVEDVWYNKNKDNSLYLSRHGFYNDNQPVGQWLWFNSDGSVKKEQYWSFINLGKSISEQEHKKELFLIRKGEIQCPGIFIYLKDYETIIESEEKYC
jgi:hypothetical protein